MNGIRVEYDLKKAVKGKVIICTDSIPAKHLQDFTSSDTDGCAEASLFRGEEIDEEVLHSPCFVGYEFKKTPAARTAGDSAILYGALESLETDFFSN